MATSLQDFLRQGKAVLAEADGYAVLLGNVRRRRGSLTREHTVGAEERSAALQALISGIESLIEREPSPQAREALAEARKAKATIDHQLADDEPEEA
jgi:hypothetical protein